VPFIFRLAALMNTTGLPAATMDSGYLTPSTAMVSLALPVGRNLPVIPRTDFAPVRSLLTE
jgi:hypothetical protein